MPKNSQEYLGWTLEVRQNPRWAWRDFKKFRCIGKHGSFHHILEGDTEDGAIARVKAAIDVSPNGW